ncbi:transglutaminase family protein [Leptothermofonsia sp. ETS-13]|uniref:transglutaminase family protein n=1 Tax=Leptothermofonsia sp. ETS-13 TaxID=3035696 RepID=UPI003B9E6717
MRYQISHTTTYRYSQPVTLYPHVVRLRPRSDSSQTLQSFSLLVTPEPMNQSQVLDLDGNSTIKVWFKPEPAESLVVQVLSQVETHQTDPFNYLLEPWALSLPIDYPASLFGQLQPYLVAQFPGYGSAIDPVAVQLAQEISQQAEGNSALFLTLLNQQIYQNCKQLIRETGDPFPPGVTWTAQAGSCRDLTVLFVEVCRAIGLAARFVTGYNEGDPDSRKFHLHAWAEVYLPGAGWRGFDPTQGLAVADRHVALVASAFYRYAGPISGSFNRAGGAQSEMSYQLVIQGINQ